MHPFSHDCSRSDGGVVAYGRAHQNGGVGADKDVTSYDSRSPVYVGVSPRCHCAALRRVGKYLRSATDLSAVSDGESTAAVDKSKRPYPAALSYFWLAYDPAVGVVRIVR